MLLKVKERRNVIMGTIVLTDKHKCIEISVAINRKPIKDYPIRLSTKICSICHRLAERLMVNQGPKSIPHLEYQDRRTDTNVNQSYFNMSPIHTSTVLFDFCAQNRTILHRLVTIQDRQSDRAFRIGHSVAQKRNNSLTSRLVYVSAFPAGCFDVGENQLEAPVTSLKQNFFVSFSRVAAALLRIFQQSFAKMLWLYFNSTYFVSNFCSEI